MRNFAISPFEYFTANLIAPVFAARIVLASESTTLLVQILDLRHVDRLEWPEKPSAAAVRSQVHIIQQFVRHLWPAERQLRAIHQY